VYNIAILSYNKDKYSETFIRNQVKHLDGKIHYLYDGAPPKFWGRDEPFVGADFISQAAQKFSRTVTGISAEEMHLRAVEKYLVQNKIDLVLANYSITAIPLLDICKRNGIPLVVHFHGWTAYRKSVLDVYGQYYPRLFEIAAGIIAVSDDMKIQLQKLGAPFEKITVAPCGADEQMFRFSDHSQNDLKFLCIGRFSQTKNQHLSILAFAAALPVVPGARLVFVGGDDEGMLGACYSLVKALRLESNVEFKGILTQNEVAELMKAGYALLQHSATTWEGDKEGTPVTILEAALAGLPIVSTNHTGIGELFEHETSALLSDEYDVEAMTKNIIRIAGDRELAGEIAVKAGERAQNFTLTKYITILNELFAKLIAGNK
jgi:glycosyltransferase involved in cell wall biosynthesis